MTDKQTATRVLVVDDDDLVRTTIVLELEDAGFYVLTASSGPEALQILKAGPVGVALIDLNMPALGGLALMTVIGIDWKDIPIIATSGAPPREGLPEGVAFLQKPYEHGQLAAAVAAAAARARESAEAAR